MQEPIFGAAQHTCAGEPVVFRTLCEVGRLRWAKKKRPAEAGRWTWKSSGLVYAVAFSTTALRQGFSTAIASSEARMLAPAAMMNTLSQLPDDCCM
jgi:hypothetical protein